MEARRAVSGDSVVFKPKGVYIFPVFVFMLLTIEGIFNFTPGTEIFIAAAIAAAVAAFGIAFLEGYRKNAGLTDLVSMLAFCWFLFACISSIWAVNRSASFVSAIGYCGAFFLFFAARAYTVENMDNRRALARAIGYAGGAISLLSIEMASTGILELLYFGPLSGFFGITAQVARFGLWVEGGRMQSLMGLPNIYASFSAMCFFLSLWLVVGGREKKDYTLDLTAVIINGTGFLLTGSRGGLLAMGGAALVYIIYCPSDERRSLTADCLTLLIWCVLTYLALLGNMGTGSPVVWLILLISINLLSYLRPSISKMFGGTRGSVLLFAAGAAAAFGLICLVLRIRGLDALRADENITQRLVYWRDGLRLFTWNPIIGLGGGAFETLAGSVADMHYASRHTHNHYIQILLENGIIGLVFMLSTCGLAFFSLWRKRLESARGFAPCLAAAVSMLMLHSVVEASLYNILNLAIFFLLLGLIAGVCTDKRRFASGEIFKNMVCVCAALSVALMGGRLLTRSYVDAAEAESTERALAAYRLAVVTDPLNASSYKAACLTRYAADPDSGAAELAARFASELERNFNTPEDCFSVARYYLKTGDASKAARYFERYIELCHVDPAAWNGVFAQYYRVFQGRESYDAEYIAQISDSAARLMQRLVELNKSFIVPVTPDEALMRGLE